MTNQQYKRSPSLSAFLKYFSDKVRKGESSRLDGCEIIVLEMYDAFQQKQKKRKVKKRA